MERASRTNNYHYNPHLKERARALRNAMTKSEAVMWKHILRGGRCLNITFNRQRPVLNYIVDFMCKELLLIIEIDGISHQFTDAAEKDAERQTVLESAGFQVIRLSASEVIGQLEKVSLIVTNAIQNRKEEFGLE